MGQQDLKHYIEVGYGNHGAAHIGENTKGSMRSLQYLNMVNFHFLDLVAPACVRFCYVFLWYIYDIVLKGEAGHDASLRIERKDVLRLGF
ncbi:unnamed protein product [Calypogeia fissa]